MNISNSGLLLTNLVWLQLMYLLVLLVLLTQGLQQLVGITTIWWPLYVSSSLEMQCIATISSLVTCFLGRAATKEGLQCHIFYRTEAGKPLMFCSLCLNQNIYTPAILT